MNAPENTSGNTPENAAPHIKVFATGGTIAGVAGSATRRDYRPGQIGIDDFLAELAAAGHRHADTGHTIRQYRV